MKNTWRILGAVVALSLAACEENNDGGGGTTPGATCTGSFSGALTGNVRTCTVKAAKLANGQLQYTIEVEPASGATVSSVSDVLIAVLGDAKTGTYSGTDVKEATSTVISTDGDKQYELQLGVGGETLGAATLTLTAVPSAAVGPTQVEGFSGSAQIRYSAAADSGNTGTVDLSLTFKR
jgi:hypothetical protein